jgi:hypothetical protein
MTDELEYGRGTDGRKDESDGSHTGSADGDQRLADESLGINIPDDHVAAFVAEALEDPERTTAWEDVVDTMVAPSARDAWDGLSAREQAIEVLSKAAAYDDRAIEQFDAVPLDGDSQAVSESIDEGLRCRRNADTFRDGVAAAYGDGLLDDDDLVAALTESEFETERIAEREDLLERVDSVYDVEYSPYGGTLMDTDDGPEPEAEHPETW